jgi:hypothetical protein
VTRPVAHNGLGFSVSLVAGEVEKIERILTAARRRMNVHGVGKILTFNIDDFTRYGIEVLHPSSVSALGVKIVRDLAWIARVGERLLEAVAACAAPTSDSFVMPPTR